MEEISALTGFDGEKTTMYGLYQAAKQLGLEAIGIKTNIEELSKLEFPAIAHIKDNHFLPLERTIGNHFRIIDLPGQTYLVTKDEFVKMWDGYLLMLSKEIQTGEKQPNIDFEEYLYDFGEGKQNQKITHNYKFKNVGNKNLVISKVKTTCSCTAALLSGSQIKPGEIAQIEITFDSRGRWGRQTQNVYIHSNDPDEPITVITLTGIVKRSISVIPRKITFLDAKTGSISTQNVRILDSGDGKLRILGTTWTSEYLSSKLSQITQGGRRGFEIETVLLDDAPLGKLNAVLTVHTNDKREPTIKIPITADIKGAIDVSPPQLFFGIVEREHPVSRSVRVTNGWETEFKILEVESSTENIYLEVTSVEKDKQYEVKATLGPTMLRGKIQGTISLHTNSNEQPIINVSFYGYVRS